MNFTLTVVKLLISVIVAVGLFKQWNNTEKSCPFGRQGLFLWPHFICVDIESVEVCTILLPVLPEKERIVITQPFPIAPPCSV